jgi:hypothetical protein
MEILFEQSCDQESSTQEDNQLLSWESDDAYSNPSETASETIQPETSEDRDFVISDTDQLSYASLHSSNQSNASLKKVNRSWYSWEINDPFQYEGLESS